MGTAEAAVAIARAIDLCMTDMLTEQGAQSREAADLPPGILADIRH